MIKNKIGKKILSPNSKPFIIAELSGNHKGSLKRALKIVEIAAKSGADAIKLQTFKPELITMKSSSKDFIILDKKSPWYKKKLHNLFEEAYTPWEWHEKIFKKAKSLGLEYLSTPFHEDAVDFLEKLNVSCYKIASFENNHIPLIEKVSRTGKTVLISTGMASFTDLKRINKIFKNRKSKYIFLKCTSSYPAYCKNLNLNTLKDIEKKFKCLTGLSDHTIGSTAACVSLGMGAKVFEKHLTISNKDRAIDSFFSADRNNFKNYVSDIREAYKSLGGIFYGNTISEKSSLQERRSIYICKTIEKGEIFTKNNIRVIRPSYGLHPRFYKSVLGKKSKIKLYNGQRLRGSHF